MTGVPIPGPEGHGHLMAADLVPGLDPDYREPLDELICLVEREPTGQLVRWAVDAAFQRPSATQSALDQPGAHLRLSERRALRAASSVRSAMLGLVAMDTEGEFRLQRERLGSETIGAIEGFDPRFNVFRTRRHALRGHGKKFADPEGQAKASAYIVSPLVSGFVLFAANTRKTS